MISDGPAACDYKLPARPNKPRYEGLSYGSWHPIDCAAKLLELPAQCHCDDASGADRLVPGGNYADHVCKKALFRSINGVNERSKKPRKEVLGGAKHWMYVHRCCRIGLCLSARRRPRWRSSHLQRYHSSLRQIVVSIYRNHLGQSGPKCRKADATYHVDRVFARVANRCEGVASQARRHQ